MIKLILIAGTGSFLGGALRCVINQLLPWTPQQGLPWSTFCCNAIGCFLIGLIYGIASNNISISPQMKLFLTVGFCGGLTTFSTFINENVLLLNSRQALTFILYTVVSIAAGLLLVWAGNNAAGIFKPIHNL